MAIIVKDTFTRADNATSLGTTETGHTWVQDAGAGTWGISGNKALTSTTLSVVLASIDTGYSDSIVSADVTWYSQNQGLVLRMTDVNNYIGVRLGASNLLLFKLVSGASTTLGTYAMTPTTGTTYAIKLTAQGSNIKVTLDGVDVLTGITETFNQTSTKTGMRATMTATGPPTFDNFQVDSFTTMIFQDSFTRADSTTSLGTPTEVGSAWTAVNGTWGISGNAGYSVTDTSGNIAVTPNLGTSDYTAQVYMKGVITGPSWREPQLVVRYTDASNFLFFVNTGSNVEFWKKDAGTNTYMGTAGAGTTTNDVYFTLKAVCSGNNITAYLNGSQVLTHTLAGGNTKFATGTSAGMRLDRGGSPATNARWDNFIVDNPASSDPTGSATLQGVGTITANGGISAINGSSTLQGVGTYTAIPVASLTGAAPLQGVGTYTASAIASRTGAAPLQGVGTYAASSIASLTGAAAFQGVGTYAASGQTSGGTTNGSATLQGVGIYAASAIASRTGDATFQGVGVYAANGKATLTALSQTLRGVGTIAANGVSLIDTIGAANLLGVGRLKVASKDIVDNFNRVDSTGLGNTDMGQTWTTVNGTFGIQSNKAYPVSGTANSFAYVDSGLRDVALSLHESVADANAIYFRISDANNWWRVGHQTAGTDLYLEKCVAGTITQVAINNTGQFNGAILRVFVSNTIIRAYLGGYHAFTWVDNTHNVNATKQGFGNRGASTLNRVNFFAIESSGYYDTFDRTSASTLGNPSSFLSWNYANGGTWAITNSAAIDASTSTAYVSTNTDGALAYSETPTPDGIIAYDAYIYGYAQNVDVSSPQVVFRMVDENNYLYAYWEAMGDLMPAFYLYKMQDGIPTLLSSYTDFGWWDSEHASMNITVHMSGRIVTVWADSSNMVGIQLFDDTDIALFEKATKVGMRLLHYGAPTKPALWDNFAFYPRTAASTEDTSLAATLQGVATVSASGKLGISRTAALQGVGTFAAAGSISGIQGASSIQGVGVFAASGNRLILNAADLQGVGTITATGTATLTGSSAMTGVGTIQATGTSGSGAFLVAVGTLSASGVLRFDGAATLIGVATFVAGGTNGGAILRGVGTMTANVTISIKGATTFIAVGRLVAAIAGTQSGAASFVGVAQMLGVGVNGFAIVERVDLLGARALSVTIKGDRTLRAPLQGERNITVGLKGSKPPASVSLGGEI